MPSNLSELNLIKKKEPTRVGIKPQIKPNTVIVNFTNGLTGIYRISYPITKKIYIFLQHPIKVSLK